MNLTARLATLFAVVVLAAAMLLAPAHAATTPAVQREIDALLADLRTSGCRFERNGTWYDGDRAADHLQRKLAYADDADIPSTEAFIDAAATRSSFSGRAYRVQCGEAAPVESGIWFRGRLGALRQKAGASD
jgi:hypothetical protein